MRIEAKDVNSSPKGYLAVFTIHVCIVIWFVHRTWIVSPERELLLFALLLGQASVIALWSVRGATRRWVRIFLAPIGIVACWFNLTRLLSWNASDAFAFFWAIVIATQTIGIVAGGQLHAWRTGAGGRRTFRLSSLIWTTVIAATAFALIRFAALHFQWSPSVLPPQLFALWITTGVINAAVALIAGSAATSHAGSDSWLTMLLWRLARIALTLTLTIVLAMILHLVLSWSFTGASERMVHLILFLGTQAATVYLSLAIARFATSRSGIHQNSLAASRSGIHQNSLAASNSGIHQNPLAASGSGIHQNSLAASGSGIHQNPLAASGSGIHQNPLAGRSSGESHYDRN